MLRALIVTAFVCLLSLSASARLDPFFDASCMCYKQSVPQATKPPVAVKKTAPVRKLKQVRKKVAPKKSIASPPMPKPRPKMDASHLAHPERAVAPVGDDGRLRRTVTSLFKRLQPGEQENARLIARAAEKHYIDPDMQLAIVLIESYFNPSKRPIDKKTGRILSSAYGLCQMLKGDRRHFGLSEAPTPEQQAEACAIKTGRNVNILRTLLSREPTPAEVYLAHYQGIGGAVSIMLSSDGDTLERALDRWQPGWGRVVLRANPWLSSTPTVGRFVRWVEQKMAAAMALTTRT